MKTKCIDESKRQNQVAEEDDNSVAYISRIINNKENIANMDFFAMVGSLRYDIRKLVQSGKPLKVNSEW